VAIQAENSNKEKGRELANRLPVERTWTPDKEAMLAGLRVALKLPRRPVRLRRENP